MNAFELTVNDRQYEVEAHPDMPLLWVLRDLLGLTGTKYGCGIGQCGVCMVHINGKSAKSCQESISEVAGDVVTIEGLSTDLGNQVKKAWIAEDVPQCGYCQPGQIMRTVELIKDLLDEFDHPTPDQIDSHIDRKLGSMNKRVLCRCGTYDSIRRAIHKAVHEMEKA